MPTSTLDTPAGLNTSVPTIFKGTAVLIFALGVLVHATRLVIGVDNVIRYVVTPPIDVGWGCLMLVSAVAGLLSWRRYSGGRAGRWAYGFMMFMLIISVPIHLRTWFVWNTDLLKTFPVWYSAVEVPMFAALSWGAARLKFD